MSNSLDLATAIAEDKDPKKGGKDVSYDGQCLTETLWGKVQGILNDSEYQINTAITYQGGAQQYLHNGGRHLRSI